MPVVLASNCCAESGTVQLHGLKDEKVYPPVSLCRQKRDYPQMPANALVLTTVDISRLPAQEKKTYRAWFNDMSIFHKVVGHDIRLTVLKRRFTWSTNERRCSNEKWRNIATLVNMFANHHVRCSRTGGRIVRKGGKNGCSNNNGLFIESLFESPRKRTAAAKWFSGKVQLQKNKWCD